MVESRSATCGGQPSPYELRFGEPLVVKKLYPFGAKIFYKLMLEDANAKGRKFERKAAEGILVGYVAHPGGKWTKDYQVLDLETVSKNYGSKFIRSRRTGDAWWKQGRFEFPFLSYNDREPLLALPPATPEPDKDAAVGDAPEAAPAAAEKKETAPPVLAPEVLAPAEVAPKKPYNAGDIMRDEDYDPARLPKGYSFEHGRITRLQKSDRPPDVLPEIWSSLNKAQKKAARKHYAETTAAEAAPVTPEPAAGLALSMSAAEAAPDK